MYKVVISGNFTHFYHKAYIWLQSWHMTMLWPPAFPQLSAVSQLFGLTQLPCIVHGSVCLCLINKLGILCHIFHISLLFYLWCFILEALWESVWLFQASKFVTNCKKKKEKEKKAFPQELGQKNGLVHLGRQDKYNKKLVFFAHILFITYCPLNTVFKKKWWRSNWSKAIFPYCNTNVKSHFDVSSWSFISHWKSRPCNNKKKWLSHSHGFQRYGHKLLIFWPNITNLWLWITKL